MADITLNPAFESFSGKMGNIVFYRRWKKIYARIYVTPRNPDTEKQRANRSLFRDAMNEWKLLSPDDKELYNRRARRLPMTGHNLFISGYMKKHLEERSKETLAERSQKASCTLSTCMQREVLSVITPSLPLSGLYTLGIPAGSDAG